MRDDSLIVQNNNEMNPSFAFVAKNHLPGGLSSTGPSGVTEQAGNANNVDASSRGSLVNESPLDGEQDATGHFSRWNRLRRLLQL